MITVEALTKRYGATTAVDNLSFQLQPGKITGFLGPNGSGKSTTMRCIMGLDRPTSGRALIAGQPYEQLTSPLTTVGALLDGKAFHGSRSARGHLQILAATHGIPARRVDEVIELTGIGSVAKRKLKGFSLGMGQRLGIAAALLGDPEVLLFDEPVNGLDPDGVRWVRLLMRTLAQQGRTILVSSHLMSEMQQTADDLLVIGRGRMIAFGPIESFTEAAANTTVLVASPNRAGLEGALRAAGLDFQDASEVAGLAAGAPEAHATPVGHATPVAPVARFAIPGGSRAAIGKIAFEAGVQLDELATVHRSLEDIFMDLTGHDVEYGAGRPTTNLPGGHR
ncbi:ATP-binding cassette domain-containing protein [Actinotignum schaalii]|uniref:ABC transporter ATP-binding protein n=1 Tax=Actinotignum schaalii TaxID=59505 RepID=UPI00237D82B6|nr:ATP-binding cassette domain-containing protein [Actinotignum schaalii]MDE1655422.1 ATP-binding cassette domain-containing protein [Actinotignum schaalii]